MKRTLSILLLSIFLCGCNISIDSSIQDVLWDKIKIGNKYIFSLKHNYTDESKYYRIEQITEEEYKNEL